MTQTRRERVRAATISEIKTIARQHMAEKGAAALSLRAIAREMGMTSPALYRYFANRDDLVTALIVDAYSALADALETARDGCQKEDYAGQLEAIARAYRHWALTNPQKYALIFGVPIPGYHAPQEVTRPVASRSMRVFLGVLDAAHRSGKTNLSGIHADFTAAVQTQVQPWADKFNFEGDPALVYVAVSNWGLIHGLVSLEIFGHLDPEHTAEDASALFDAEMALLPKRLNLTA